ncbi:FmdB family zinc ribbon protein [Glaciimonas sp. GG7]
MPIYAYRCDECGFAKDVLQKMSDAQLTVCPTCQKESFKKQVTAAGFQLKGTGWYVTDFRGGAATGGASKGASDEGSSSASASTSTTESAAATPAASVAPASGASAPAAPSTTTASATPSKASTPAAT